MSIQKVRLHQGSVPNPLLSCTVMNVVMNEGKSGLPWELLYADDLAFMVKEELGKS